MGAWVIPSVLHMFVNRVITRTLRHEDRGVVLPPSHASVLDELVGRINALEERVSRLESLGKGSGFAGRLSVKKPSAAVARGKPVQAKLVVKDEEVDEL